MKNFEDFDIKHFFLHQEGSCNKSLSKDGKDGKDDAIPSVPLHHFMI